MIGHVDQLSIALAEAGLEQAETRRVDGHPFTFLVFRQVPVTVGRHRGLVLQHLALPIPDDAMLPPPGIHTQPHLGVIGERNVHASPLGADWAYWSRPIQNFAPARGVPRILSHINSIFRDA